MSGKFTTALKLLETFSEVGLTLSPANPTDYMCHVGAKVGGVDAKTARKIYRFMCDAALDEYCRPEDVKTKEKLNEYLDNMSKNPDTKNPG